MFDGNTFFPVTGTPILKMACMMSPLAEAEPVPLAVAILKAKSLTRSMDTILGLREVGVLAHLSACGTTPRHRGTEFDQNRTKPRMIRLAIRTSHASATVTGCPAAGMVTTDFRMSHA